MSSFHLTRQVLIRTRCLGSTQAQFSSISFKSLINGQNLRIKEVAASSRFMKSYNFMSTTGEENKSSPDEELSPEEMKATIDELQSSVDDLKSKHDELTDKYRRSLAENENMRKRLTKQIEESKVFGIQSFAKDLLEVADVLSTATKTENQSADDLRNGLQMTEAQLGQVFKRHGLEAVNPIDEKFDPNKHEALFQVPDPEKEVNTVVDVQKIGYTLHGRTIRPALVGVSKK